MKKLLLVTLSAVLLIFINGCTKEQPKEELESYYTEKQTEVLNLFNGSYISEKNIVGDWERMVFIEQYREPKTLIGINMYSEEKEIVVHGIVKMITYDNGEEYLSQDKAYYIDSNGKDIRMYRYREDGKISTNSSSEKYKITILSKDSYKFFDMNFPYNPYTYTKE